MQVWPVQDVLPRWVLQPPLADGPAPRGLNGAAAPQGLGGRAPGLQVDSGLALSEVVQELREVTEVRALPFGVWTTLRAGVFFAHAASAHLR